MSEPHAAAHDVVEILPGIHRWWLSDDRIGGAEGDSYAFTEGRHVTLVDPHPVDAAALARLGDVEAIVVTAPCHQRAAWGFRRTFGAPVFAPEGAHVGSRAGDFEEVPDIRYAHGDVLTAGLVAVHAPGPDEEMYALWRDRGGVLYLSDQLTHDGSGVPAFVPDAYQEAPSVTRASIAALRDALPVRVLCFGHGPPILERGHDALERALARDARGAERHPE